MNLSERLTTIIDMVDPCHCAADIGTDHGFVPIALVENGKAQRAIASDVGEGPILRAQTHVREKKMAGKIDCRLGDGLKTLEKGEADCVIVTGMGGMLIGEILKNSPEIVSEIKELILSPHTDVPYIRTLLPEYGFEITDERMVEEDGKYYWILKAISRKNGEGIKTVDSGVVEHLNPIQAASEEVVLDPMVTRLGAFLPKTRPEVFLRYLDHEEKRLSEVLAKLPDDSVKALEIREELAIIRDARSVRQVRHSKAEDIPAMLEIYKAARQFMRETGNPNQWGEDRPTEETLWKDLELGNGYVITENDEVVGTFALIGGADPTYGYIENGSWPNDEPYMTIHRIAGTKVKGILFTAVRYALQRTKNLRIDTHHDNKVMQQTIAKNGFGYCGIIYLEDGDPRLAYQRVKA